MYLELHTKEDCPYCTKAKDYLIAHDLPYVTVQHDDTEQRQLCYDEWGLVGLERTMPQLFVVDGQERTRIGGFAEMERTNVASLKPELREKTESEQQAQREWALQQDYLLRHEPVFTLRSTDQFATQIVELWISLSLRELGNDHPKIASARKKLGEIAMWQAKHGAKHPD